MNTIPTHLVINAAIEKTFGARFRIARSAFLWGSVVPDFPLLFMSVGTFLYFRYFTTENISGMMDQAFGEMYFNDPVWIAGHNFLHSPTALFLYILFLWRFFDKPDTRGHWWLSFVLGCLVHSMIDILTHFDDGPVLFFPFDWHTRFYSPVSYWDKAHYASQFFYFELGLNTLLLGYLILPGIARRIRERSA